MPASKAIKERGTLNVETGDELVRGEVVQLEAAVAACEDLCVVRFRGARGEGDGCEEKSGGHVHGFGSHGP
jgi:hypothetical protein